MVTVDTPLIEIDESPEIVTVSLNRPDSYNALNPELIVGLETTLEALSDEPTAAILIRGNGPATCAGFDTDIVTDPDYDPDTAEFQESLRNFFDLLRTYPRTTAFAGHGAVVGAGVNIALCCDFTALGTDTTLQYPEIQFGLVSQETMHLMATYVGVRMTKEFILTGEALAPERAAEVGLVNDVVPGDEVDDAARTYLEQTVDHDPDLVAEAKRTLDYRDSETFWTLEESDLQWQA